MKHLACLLILAGLAATAAGQELSLSHGKHELERILNDRPSMKGVLPDDDVITRWVVRKLCTGAAGEQVIWDNTEPEGELAQHVPGNAAVPAKVRLTASDSMTGRDKWYLLVFELHNLLHPAQTIALQRAVKNDTMTRDEFVHAILDHEYERLARTNRFFKRYPIPDANLKNAPAYSAYMTLGTTLFKGEVRLQTLRKMNGTEYGARVVRAYGAWYDEMRPRNDR